MKKIINAFFIVILIIINFSCVYGASIYEKEYVNFYIMPNENNGITNIISNLKSYEYIKDNEKVYRTNLYLPGNASLESCKLTWTLMSVKDIKDEDGISVKNGKVPIAPANEIVTYIVEYDDGYKQKYEIKTVQGSSYVEPLYIEIDETLGTIRDMNQDRTKETSCYGTITVDGTKYNIKMKGRGNATWVGLTEGKKPYNITLIDGKASLYGMEENKKWSILTNYPDRTLLRNKIGYDLACNLGIGLESKFIDVWINGEYLGNYLITPKVDENAPDEGYMLELDNYYANEIESFFLELEENYGNVITIKDNGANESIEDIKAYLQEARSAIIAEDGISNTGKYYTEYFDIESWAKLYLLNELYKNYDVASGSIFINRDGTSANDKLYTGPVWDLDNSFGRTSFNEKIDMKLSDQMTANGWYIDKVSERIELSWLKQLGEHEDFMEEVYRIYNEYKTEFDNLLNSIDKMAENIKESANMNYTLYDDILDNNRTYSNFYNKKETILDEGTEYKLRYVPTNTWEDYVTNLKSYVRVRNLFFENTILTGKAFIEPKTKFSNEFIVKVSNTKADTKLTYQWYIDGVEIPGANLETYKITLNEVGKELSVKVKAQNLEGSVASEEVVKVKMIEYIINEYTLLCVIICIVIFILVIILIRKRLSNNK